MFRKELEKRLKNIFGFRKISFDAPSESFEQDTLFVDISEVRTNAAPGKASAYVRGSLSVFSQNDKLPYGYFNKRLQTASASLTKSLFFYDIDTNVLNSPARMQNISERRTSFVFLYSEQYDPNRGQLTQVNYSEEQSG